MNCQVRKAKDVGFVECPGSAPVGRRKFLRFGKLSASTSPKPSPNSTPRSIRKRVHQSLNDVLRCGSSFPSVNSFEFKPANDTADEEDLDRQFIQSEPKLLQKSEKYPSTDQLYSNEHKMGNKCSRVGRRRYSSSDEDLGDELTDPQTSMGQVEKETIGILNGKTANLGNQIVSYNGDDRFIRPSSHSTPTQSPQRQLKPKFWQNFQQFRETSRERLHRMSPKKTLLRKFSSGNELAIKNSNSKLSKSKLALENDLNDLTDKKETSEDDFVTFRLRIHLKEGHGLVIRDASGSSDPYVKFRYNERTVYKSNTILKNLNPQWNEDFSFLIHDPLLRLDVEVFDYDRFMRDDFMGTGKVDLSLLRLFQKHQIDVKLEGGDATEDYMGYLTMDVEITPMTEKQKQLFLSRADRGVVSETLKRNTKSASVWLSVVNVVLVEAKLNQTTLNNQQPPDVYAKLKLNSEKCKSKVIPKTFEPRWTELFDLHIYDETSQQLLDLMICHKNSVLGKCSIDLSDFEREMTKEKCYELDNDAGTVRMLITISGTSSSTVVANLNEYVGNRDVIIDKYSLHNSFRNTKDIGHLTVKVYRAEGLASADLGGKSDPFCVLELVNARLQTQTIYKSLDPVWDKLLTFAVKDIHEILEVTVFDEDPNKKFEFLGKVAIPLLKIRNCEKRWYGLKDRKLRLPVKGRILIELDVLWNPVKAALRTFNPRERKFLAQEQRFKRAILVNNVNRLKEFWSGFTEYRDYMKSCLMWESYPRSITAMICFVIFVYFFELYHLPILLLVLFAKSHVRKRISESIENRYWARTALEIEGTPLRSESDEEDESFDNSVSQRSRKTNDSDGKNEEHKTAEKSTSLRGRITAIQDTLTVVQNSMDFVACLMERIRNTFNFTVPYLSYLAIIILCIATILLYFVPLRWIIMAWGLNKFTKRLRKPHYIENNELLDFLSRIPSDQEQRNFRELKGNCEEPRTSIVREGSAGTPISNSPSNNGSIKKTN